MDKRQVPEARFRWFRSRIPARPYGRTHVTASSRARLGSRAPGAPFMSKTWVGDALNPQDTESMGYLIDGASTPGATDTLGLSVLLSRLQTRHVLPQPPRSPGRSSPPITARVLKSPPPARRRPSGPPGRARPSHGTRRKCHINDTIAEKRKNVLAKRTQRLTDKRILGPTLHAGV